jgi:hypothetical protein
MQSSLDADGHDLETQDSASSSLLPGSTGHDKILSSSDDSTNTSSESSSPNDNADSDDADMDDADMDDALRESEAEDETELLPDSSMSDESSNDSESFLNHHIMNGVLDEEGDDSLTNLFDSGI